MLAVTIGISRVQKVEVDSTPHLLPVNALQWLSPSMGPDTTTILRSCAAATKLAC